MLAQPSDNLDLDLSRLLGRLSVLENFFQYLRIHHKRLDIVAHGLDVDILVDEFDGLGPQGVPEQSAVAARRLHRFIDLRQPSVIFLVWTQYGVRRQRFPDRAEYRVLSSELVAQIVVREALLRGHEAFVAADAPIHAWEEDEAFLHLDGQNLP